jgi:hypothetical protein
MRKTLKRNHTAIHRVAALAVSALLLVGETGVHAGAAGQANGSSGPPYTFVTVLDSQRDGLDANRCPAINTRGTIAVTVTDTVLGGTKIITKRAANDLPVIIADTAVAGDFPTFCDNGFNNLPSDPSINENGEVAFQGNLRRVTTRAECSTPGAARPAARSVPRRRWFVDDDCTFDQRARRQLHRGVSRRRPVGEHVR